MKCRLSLVCVLVLVFVGDLTSAAPPFESYFYDGKLAEGEKVLTRHLQKHPEDQQRRFALGTILLLRTYEKLILSLYEHSLQMDLVMTWGGPWLKPHPRPKTLTHAKLYATVQTALEDLKRARKHLSQVRSDKVKLVLAPARIKFCVPQVPTPLHITMWMARRSRGPLARHEVSDKPFKKMVIAFDRADAAWLCGYCHFLSALGEAMQAFEGKELFERFAHLFFSKVQTPYAFLMEERKALSKLNEEDLFKQWGLNADFFILGIFLLNVPVKEPRRLTTAIDHLEMMVKQSRLMWRWILAEKDNDREWIPSPKQQSAIGVKVTKELVQDWKDVLDEVESLLRGKKLLPFWRGTRKDRGVNFRKPFTHPGKTFNIPAWVQGTAAAPYLEKGTITKLADPTMLRRLDRNFGGLAFFGFAFWFN